MRFINTLIIISSSSKAVSQSRVLAGACAAIPLGTCTQLGGSELLSQFAQKNARGVKTGQGVLCKGVFQCVDTWWGTARPLKSVADRPTPLSTGVHLGYDRKVCVCVRVSCVLLLD